LGVVGRSDPSGSGHVNDGGGSVGEGEEDFGLEEAFAPNGGNVGCGVGEGGAGPTGVVGGGVECGGHIGIEEFGDGWSGGEGELVDREITGGNVGEEDVGKAGEGGEREM